LRAHGDEHPPLAGRKLVTVRTIKMSRDTARSLGHVTKLDRDPGHLRALRDEGRDVARAWLEGWRADRESFPSYPDDARYPVG
jgi:hypothetical protein